MPCKAFLRLSDNRGANWISLLYELRQLRSDFQHLKPPDNGGLEQVVGICRGGERQAPAPGIGYCRIGTPIRACVDVRPGRRVRDYSRRRRWSVGERQRESSLRLQGDSER